MDNQCAICFVVFLKVGECMFESYVEHLRHFVVLIQATNVVIWSTPRKCSQNCRTTTLSWLVSNYDCSCSTFMKLLQISFCYKLVFFNWIGTPHSSTHHPSIKTQALFVESRVEKNSNMVINIVLTKGCFLSCKPKQCLQRLLTLLVMYIIEYMVYCSWKQFNKNTTKLQSIIHIDSISIAQYTFQIHISRHYFNLNLQLDHFISIPFGYK